MVCAGVTRDEVANSEELAEALRAMSGAVEATATAKDGDSKPCSKPSPQKRKSSSSFSSSFPSPSSSLSSSSVSSPPPSAPSSLSVSLSSKRSEALRSLLTWIDPSYSSTVSVNAADCRGRTALHYAAQLGRRSLCQALVAAGAILTIVEEESQQTPCELAGEAGFKDLSAWLEARAVFEITLYRDFGADYSPDSSAMTPYCWFANLTSDLLDKNREERVKSAKALLASLCCARSGAKSGAKSDPFGHECRKGGTLTGDGGEFCKDLLSSFADKYVPSSFTDEQTVQLLTCSNWDEGALERKFLEDPVGMLREGRMELGAEQIREMFEFEEERQRKDFKSTGEDEGAALSDEGEALSSSSSSSSSASCCPICMDDYDPSDPSDAASWIKLGDHGHEVCSSCLEMHIGHAVTQQRAGLTIRCPFQGCPYFVSRKLLEGNSSEEVMEKLLRNERDSFVFSAKDLKYCPIASCECIIRLKVPNNFRGRWGPGCLDSSPAVCNHFSDGNNWRNVPDNDLPSVLVTTRDGVVDNFLHEPDHQPVAAHRFCWSCEELPHWPIPCDMREQWLDKVHEEVGEPESAADGESFEEVAHRLWIKANTKECPKCRTPIEKNEGCNHMVRSAFCAAFCLSVCSLVRLFVVSLSFSLFRFSFVPRRLLFLIIHFCFVLFRFP